MRMRAARGMVTLALVATLAACAPLGAASPPTATAPPTPWSQPGERASADPDAAMLREAQRIVAGMTLREKAATVVMTRPPSPAPAAARAALAATGIGGVMYLGADIQNNAAAAAALSAGIITDPALPPLTAIDQEGGTVARLPDTGPSARALQMQPPEVTREAFAARAALVASAGVDINFGIVADVTPDASSFLRSRIFGQDASTAAPRVAAAVAGERGIVLSTLKHFPGHGAAPGDSHRTIPRTDMGLDVWRATQLPPFQAGIDAGAELVMMGHLRYTAIDAAPASLSAPWYRLLRSETGFAGVAVTDDLSMLESSGEPGLADPYENGLAALAAGADLLLYAGNVDPVLLTDRITEAVGQGRISAERLDDAAVRVVQLRRAVATPGAHYVVCGAECRAGIR